MVALKRRRKVPHGESSMPLAQFQEQWELVLDLQHSFLEMK